MHRVSGCTQIFATLIWIVNRICFLEVEGWSSETTIRSLHGEAFNWILQSSWGSRRPSCSYQKLPLGHLQVRDLLLWMRGGFPFDSLKIDLYYHCSEVVGGNWQDSAVSVLDIYRELLNRGLRIWMFRFCFLNVHSGTLLRQRGTPSQLNLN